MRKFFSIAICLLLAVCLCACAASEMAGDYVSNNSGSMKNDYESGELTSKEDSLLDTALPANHKLIQKVWLTAETEDMTTLLAQTEEQIVSLGGYIEAQQIRNGSMYSSYRYRSAELTIRIPADKLDSFVNQISQVSNIVSSNKTVDDITLQYVATESRVLALQTEQERLLELLTMATTLEDVLSIEDRLTDVRAELEQVTSTLKVYENQVSYGTVYLNVQEVREYTDVTEPETIWQRIGKGFVDSLQNVGDFFVELFVFLIVRIPYWVLLAAVVTVLVLLIKHSKKKKQQKKARRQSTPDQTT